MEKKGIYKELFNELDDRERKIAKEESHIEEKVADRDEMKWKIVVNGKPSSLQCNVKSCKTCNKQQNKMEKHGDKEAWAKKEHITFRPAKTIAHFATP